MNTDLDKRGLPREFSGVNRNDILTGGVQMIPIETPKGTFRVWTKRVGDHPTIKVLLLHGGPGMTHEYLEAFDSYFPQVGFEFYYYDQLGSYYSDQPDEPDLWELPRFVEEVEQVRQFLGLDRDNFYLYGHSWGGILAIEYALKYQQHLKGLIISNMMASAPAYNEYAQQVLMPTMPPEVVAEIQQIEAQEDYDNPRYMELLVSHHYVYHVLRMPLDQWVELVSPSGLTAVTNGMPPDQWVEPLNRAFKHLNPDIYVPLQGPSELGIKGKLSNWDRTADLAAIAVPTLVIGSQHDTMNPAHLEWMAKTVNQGRYLFCPEGSHLAIYDDQQVYFEGLIQFIQDVDAVHIAE